MLTVNKYCIFTSTAFEKCAISYSSGLDHALFSKDFKTHSRPTSQQPLIIPCNKFIVRTPVVTTCVVCFVTFDSSFARPRVLTTLLTILLSLKKEKVIYK